MRGPDGVGPHQPRLRVRQRQGMQCVSPSQHLTGVQGNFEHRSNAAASTPRTVANGASYRTRLQTQRQSQVNSPSFGPQTEVPVEILEISTPASTSARRKSSQMKKNGNWSDGQLQCAIMAVDEGMSIRASAVEFHIPVTSLRDHLYGLTRSRKRGGPTVLTVEEETQVADWVKRMQQCGYPITLTSLRLKVGEICEGRPTPFRNGMPGQGWLKWWRKRNPDIVLRHSQGLDKSRARGLCKENVQSFYSNLSKLYDMHAYPPSRVWNCDESGCQAGRNGGCLVLARKGARSVHSIIPDQREWLSVLVCVNAAGIAIPSFYIFKGKRFRKNYIAKCEPGATMAMQPRAWMTAFLFSKWISHFIKCVQETDNISPSNRHLLVLDGHNSHVTLDVVYQARDVGLDILTLPSHTSHALQPLDVSLFKPFKVAFRWYRDAWTERNTSQKATKVLLAQWVSLSLKRALTVDNITRGFEGTGIYPLNPAAMESKMDCSERFEQEDTRTRNEEQHHRIEVTEVSVEDLNLEMQQEPSPSTTHYFVQVEEEDGISSEDSEDLEDSGTECNMLEPVGAAQFLTLPALSVSTRNKSKNTATIDWEKSVMLTSDEYVEALEARTAQKEEAEKIREHKRREREDSRKRKMEQRAEQEMVKTRKVQERRMKHAFDKHWSAANVSKVGQDLHNRIASKGPLLPTEYHAPLCGIQLPIYKYNQHCAIQRRRARKKKMETTGLSPCIEPVWVHQTGAPFRANSTLQLICRQGFITTPMAPRSMEPMPNSTSSADPPQRSRYSTSEVIAMRAAHANASETQEVTHATLEDSVISPWTAPQRLVFAPWSNIPSRTESPQLVSTNAEDSQMPSRETSQRMNCTLSRPQPRFPHSAT